MTDNSRTFYIFATTPDPMPDVIVKAWNEIWQMPDAEFASPRRYHTDFEVYDERAADHQNIVLDIYIGVED